MSHILGSQNHGVNPSEAYIKELGFYKFQISMNRKGNPFENEQLPRLYKCHAIPQRKPIWGKPACQAAKSLTENYEKDCIYFSLTFENYVKKC